MHTVQRRTVALLSSALAAAALAAGPSAAQAHHAAAVGTRTVRAALGPAPTVTVRVTKAGLDPSRSRIRPGNTIFDVVRAGSGGSVELARFRGDYGIKRFFKDAQGLFSGDVKAVRRVDRHLIAYGGMAAVKGSVTRFAVNLRRGDYYVINLDKGSYARLHVRGAREARPLPHAPKAINFVADDRFGAPSGVPHQGWVRNTNRTDEPHFTSMLKIKEGTTRRQVRKYFANGGQGQPGWALREFHDALVVSPGHTMRWYVDGTRGKYLLACWWPSHEDGMPHALMGMWDLIHLN